MVRFCKGCKGAALTLRSCARGERLRNTLPLSASSNLSDPAKKGQTLIYNHASLDNKIVRYIHGHSDFRFIQNYQGMQLGHEVNVHSKLSLAPPSFKLMFSDATKIQLPLLIQ